MFGINKEAFRHRLAEILQRRLETPGLTAKIIAHAIGCHPDTVLNLANAGTTADGPTIEALAKFFGSIGDYNFIGDLYGDLRVHALRRAAKLEADAKRCREAARLLESAA